MFDRDLAVEAGLYDVEDLHVEDYGLWVRLLRKGRFVALPQVLHRYRFHDASVSRTNMAAQTEGLVTLARGQLVDLGLELSREDVRPLQHFGLCATTAAYRIPRSGPPQRHRSAPEGGSCLLLSPAPERAGHLAEPPIASVSTSRLAMCGGVVVCHGARGS